MTAFLLVYWLISSLIHSSTFFPPSLTQSHKWHKRFLWERQGVMKPYWLPHFIMHDSVYVKCVTSHHYFCHWIIFTFFIWNHPQCCGVHAAKLPFREGDWIMGCHWGGESSTNEKILVVWKCLWLTTFFM